VESKPAPVPEAVVATAIDRKMVARMREVEAPPGGGAVKWVVLARVMATASSNRRGRGRPLSFSEAKEPPCHGNRSNESH
jgi:hypothetical protein